MITPTLKASMQRRKERVIYFNKTRKDTQCQKDCTKTEIRYSEKERIAEHAGSMTITRTGANCTISEG